MKNTPREFPGLKWKAKEIHQFIRIENHFTLILENGDIVKFDTENAEKLLIWLTDHNISNIRSDKE